MSDQLPLATAIEMFLVFCQAKNLSPRTISWYAEKLGAFERSVHDLDGRVPTVGDLTTSMVSRFVVELSQRPKWANHPFTRPSSEPVSGTYVQGFVRTFKVFATFLNDEGYTATNRLSRFRMPKAHPPLIEPLTQQEMQRVLDACQTARDHALILTMLDTGLRAGELVRLRLEDARVDQHPATLLVLGKGGRQRPLPISPQTQRVLQRYKHDERPSDAFANTLFVTSRGEPLTHQTLKMLFLRLRCRSGVTRIHPHLLRHTFATQFLQNGGDLFTLQVILGHRSLEMVRRYSHLATGHVIARHREFSPVALLGGRSMHVRKAEKTRRRP